MSSLDSSNNLDEPVVFTQITKPEPFTEPSFFETIRLVKLHIHISKNATSKMWFIQSKENLTNNKKSNMIKYLTMWIFSIGQKAGVGVLHPLTIH